MKRVLAVIFLSLLVMQLCLLPMAVTAKCNTDVSTITLPVTNFTDSSATLIGTWTSLGTYPLPLYVSFQYGTEPGVYNIETPQIEKSLSEIGTFPFQANISNLSPCTTYYVRTQLHYDQNANCTNYVGNVVSFQTTGCLPPPPPSPAPINPLIGTGAPTSHGGSSVSGPTSPAPPVSLPSLVIQSASLSAKAVTPGTPIIVTADIANKSSVNGNKKVTLYVNGQVETTQGITVNSGGSTKLTFNVSRSEPGDYTVYVDGVPAGSFKVELFRESDGILVFSAGLVGLAFILGMVMLWRRQQRTV